MAGLPFRSPSGLGRIGGAGSRHLFHDLAARTAQLSFQQLLGDGHGTGTGGD
jgi:hypothetical protein